MQLLRGLGNWPMRIAFSPDGQYLGAGDDRSFHLWDVSAGAAPLWSSTDSTLGRSFTFAPDGGSVAYAYYDGVTRFDARTGAKIDQPELTGLNQSCFAPDGRIVVAVVPNQLTHVLQLRGVRPTTGGWRDLWHKDRPFDPHIEWYGFRALLFSSDGTRLVRLYALERNQRNVSRTGIEVFDTATGDSLAGWAGALPTYAREGAVGSRGTVVLLRDRALYAIDTTLPESSPVKRLNVSQKHFTAAAFAPDGSRLATTSNDTAATIWDAANWEVRKRYEWNIGRLRAVCFAPDGLRCAAASDTGQVVVWDLDD